MWKQLDFRAFFNFLGRNKLYTSINLFGFAVSLAFVILIADYTIRQFSTDAFQEKADRIVLLHSEDHLGSAWRLADHLLPRYPEIEKICCIAPFSSKTVEIDDRAVKADLLFADTTFFDVFSFRMRKGDPREALAGKDQAVLSESFARQMFGTDDPLGRTVALPCGDSTIRRVVSGVMEDIDHSVLPSCDVVMRFDNVEYYNSSLVSPYMSNAGQSCMFVLQHEGADLRAKIPDMEALFREVFWIYRGGAVKEVCLTPLRDIYFCTQTHTTDLRGGDRSFVLLLFTVGVVVLVFAVMNYVNLTTAQTGFRAREMATRRLLGASRGEVVLKTILESTLLCAVAFAAAYLLALWAEPAAERLLGDRIDLWGDLTAIKVLCYAVLIVLLGTISGVIPAWMVSRFKPIDVVRGTLRRRTKMLYSNVLIVVQMVITMLLVAGSLTINLQIRHLIEAPLGYETRDIFDVELFRNHFRNYSEIQTFREEVRQLSCVEEIAFSCGTPLNRGNNNTMAYGRDRMVSFQVFYADSLFFRIFDIRLKQDNGLDEEAWFMNEAAFRELEIPETSLEVKLGPDLDWVYPIGGIYEDFHIGQILQPQSAALIFNVRNFDAYNEKGNSFYPWDIVIKTVGDHTAARDAICEVGRRVTGSEFFEGSFIEEQIAEAYSDQRRMAYILLIFTVVALVISALGLLAISTYYIRQKEQEIAVRKVFGSTSGEVLGRLLGFFLRLTVVAFVAAVPLVWWTLDRWLSDYSERIPLSPLIFLVAGLFVAVVALATVLWQSSRAASANPIASIKG